MHTDPIADMLTRIRNANRAGHNDVRMPFSKMKHAILQVMAKNNFVEEVNIETSGKFQELHVILGKPQYRLELKRVSKPGQRIYVKSTEIPAVMDGLGIAILSTPKGVLSSIDAKKGKVGGELLCIVA